MATRGPNRSVKKQKRTISKRNSDEDQTADVTCTCRPGKKTLCQYCMQSPKKAKLIKGEILGLVFCYLCIATFFIKYSAYNMHIKKLKVYIKYGH